MPTQKVFKRRVRVRMTKTGESYTAARRQLLRKVEDPAAPALEEPTNEIPVDALLVADESMRRATGKSHAEWFALLDAWGAADHNHTEIARWLNETHATPGWWTQNITVAYERARGMRRRHQMASGFSISVTRTVAVETERALAAFTNARQRGHWLRDAEMRPRPTRGKLTARFDWSDPPSRVVVTIVPKGADKSTVAVGHEQLPDAEAAERLKTVWRERLADLRVFLERG